jgi:hypothetical protein
MSMQPLFNAATAGLAVLIAGLVWRRTRAEIGRVGAGTLSAVAGISVAAALYYVVFPIAWRVACL